MGFIQQRTILNQDWVIGSLKLKNNKKLFNIYLKKKDNLDFKMCVYLSETLINYVIKVWGGGVVNKLYITEIVRGNKRQTLLFNNWTVPYWMFWDDCRN